MSATSDDREKQIDRLLSELNFWERQHGTTYANVPNLGSTGEANARIDDLKSKLTKLEARFHWNGEEYVLDASSTSEPENL